MSGQLRPVELADRADHGAGVERLLGAVGGAHDARATRRRRRPRWPSTTSVAKRMCADQLVAFACTSLEVRLQLGLLGEVLGPVVGGLEGVAVEVVADVDAAAGVAVLAPGAADAGVLLDDRERDAGLLQPDAGEQAGLAAADHDDREARRGPRRARWWPRRAGRRRRAPSPRASSGRTRRARGSQTSHAIISLMSSSDGRRGQHAVAVAVGDDRLEGAGPHLGLLLLGHVALDLVEEQPERA